MAETYQATEHPLFCVAYDHVIDHQKEAICEFSNTQAPSVCTADGTPVFIIIGTSLAAAVLLLVGSCLTVTLAYKCHQKNPLTGAKEEAELFMHWPGANK